MMTPHCPNQQIVVLLLADLAIRNKFHEVKIPILTFFWGRVGMTHLKADPQSSVSDISQIISAGAFISFHPLYHLISIIRQKNLQSVMGNWKRETQN